MPKKCDTTKRQILAAACELFARQGYQDTTTQQICEQAGANIAAVHYHYQSKENLYLAVWEALGAEAEKLRTERLDLDAPAEEQLRQFIAMEVETILSKGSEGWFPRLLHREMAYPTPVHEDLRRRYARPRKRYLQGLIGQILGREPDEIVIHQAAFCIHGPLMHLLELRTSGCRRRGSGHRHRRRDPKRLAETMYHFALGGIRELDHAMPEPKDDTEQPNVTGDC